MIPGTGQRRMNVTRAEIERVVKASVSPEEIVEWLNQRTKFILEEVDTFEDLEWNKDDAFELINWLLDKLETKASDA